MAERGIFFYDITGTDQTGQICGCNGIPRDKKYPGGIAVQTVHRKDLRTGLPCQDVDDTDRNAGAALHGYAAGLVYNENVGILVENRNIFHERECTMNGKKNLPGRYVMILIFLIITTFTLPAEILVSEEWGYALDLPEGFALEQKEGSTRYRFSHNMFPVTLQIAIYGLDDFSSAEETLRHVTGQYKSTGEQVAFSWRFREAAIARLAFEGGAGWAACAELADDKGYLVLAIHTDEKQAVAMEAVMISTLDSIATDRGAWHDTGPMTAFAWAPEAPVAGSVSCGERTVLVPFNTVDAPANQAVVDREFSLLTAYLDTPFVYPAWERYYRVIYRDAWKRLEKAAFLMESCMGESTEEKLATLLGWTQKFSYQRNHDGADFVSLPEAFLQRTGDCDSRALLLVLLLKQMGIDGILLISPEYSHALAAIDCPGEGARFAYDGKKYLIAETTANVAPGLIDSSMADPEKWFAIRFPDPAIR